LDGDLGQSREAECMLVFQSSESKCSHFEKGEHMSYTEKFTWGGKELIVKRQISPVDILSAESKHLKLEKINVNDPALRPSNYDKAEGTPLPVFQADGVRVDVSKRTKEPMTFWHRNMDCDELIFCHKGGINWETELGNISLGPGEMFVIPKGIAHRSLPPENSEGENIVIELKIRGEVSKLI
jgi:quercetin dioxygenase-like cupin family protein